MVPETIQKALAEWIALDTWHTWHHLALGHFYDFVTVLCEERFMDEGLIRRLIDQDIDTCHPDFDAEERERLVDVFVELSEQIYRYKVLRNFKDIRGIGASCWWCP